MRILFLTPRLPFPPDGGGLIKSFRLIRFLAGKHELTLALLLKQGDRPHLEAFRGASGAAEVFCEDLEVARNGWNLLFSYLRRVPLAIFRNFSRRLRRRLSRTADRYDVIFVDHYLMCQYVPEGFRGKVVLHEHNAEYVLWERMAALERNPAKRMLIKAEAARVKAYERAVCGRADRILCAPNDMVALGAIGVRREKMRLTYHLGDESLLGRPALRFEEADETLLFVGTMTWEPNVDGLVVFIQSCWRRLKAEIPRLRLVIAGKDPDPRILREASLHEGIEIRGYVPDLEPLFRSSRVFISPLRFGSGMKVKVLNAMYRGIPVSTTAVGVEGMEVRDGEEVLVAGSIEAMVEGILRLLRDRTLWETVRDGSRKLVSGKYTWDHVLSEVDRALETGSGQEAAVATP